jgi:hypothetical protein
MSIDPMTERAATVRAIQSMPAKNVKIGLPLNKKDAEDVARKFGKMKNRVDHRVAEFPINTVGKILRNKGFDVSTIMADIPSLYENAIPGCTEEETTNPGRKKRVNIPAYHNYINKFARPDGAEYYIRFTVMERETKAGKNNDNLIHSTAISEVTIYQNKDAVSQSLRGIDPLIRDAAPFVDKKLQEFFDSVNPDLTLNAPGARGSIDFSHPQAIINLFKGRKDVSTPIHELGHFFLNNLQKAVNRGTAPEWAHKAWTGLQEAYGFDGTNLIDGTAASRAVHERFANDFVAYVREGKAPSPQLETAFRRFMSWLNKLYRSVRKLLGDQELDPRVREVFDHLLATEEEIAEAREAGPQNVLEKFGDTLQADPELLARHKTAMDNAVEHAQARPRLTFTSSYMAIP